jgi:hypothetical protein
MSKRSFGRRALDWFWVGTAMATLRDSGRLPSERTVELGRRARAALEVGRLALEPPHPFEHGPVDALICQLSAEAVYWSLLALRAAADDQAAEALPEAPAEPPATGPTLASLIAEADQEVLARTAGTPEASRELAREIEGRSFTEYADLPRAEAARLARRLLPFAEGLVDRLDSVRAEVERIWMLRVVRVGLLAAAVGVLAWGVSFASDKIEQARDLSRGKPWVASSRYPEYGCTSPAQVCPNSDIYFFCTNEEDNPRIEWDLGSPKRVSGVRVNNRTDCCVERAVPLIVEVSLDHQAWKEVAHRTEEFTTWKASFAPVQARYVRFRAPRRTFLHFTGVRILP